MSKDLRWKFKLTTATSLAWLIYMHSIEHTQIIFKKEQIQNNKALVQQFGLET